MRLIFKQIKEFKKESILAPFCAIAEVFNEMAIPFLIAKMIDEGIQKNSLQMTLQYGLYMLIAACFALFFGIMSARLATYAAAGLAKNLRYALFEKIQSFSFKNIDKYSTAGLVTRMMTDVSNTQRSFQMLIRIAIRSPLALIASTVMAFAIGGDFAFILLAVVGVFAVLILIITVISFGYFDKVYSKYDKLNLSIQENVTNIRVVKAYVKEEKEIQKFTKASQAIYSAFTKAGKIIIFSFPLMFLTLYTIVILFSWFGAHSIYQGNLTTGQLTSLLTYASNILGSLMMLSFIVVDMIISISSIKRIIEVFNEKIDLTNCEHPITDVADGSIEFENVSFKYYDHKDDYVLKNINLKIQSGETIGILGGTGSGKSSLVQLIPRLYDISSGTLKVGGIDVKQYDLKTLRQSVSMVLQKNVLFSGTINDNLRWGNADATEAVIIENAKLAQAHQFISNFEMGYETYIEQGGTNVSGGQKQRLTIARALISNPKILILDDSTSAVDTKTDKLIKQAFKNSLKDTTKLIISQRISSLEDADRIVVLNKGEISGIGTHESLLKDNTIYKETYATQVKGSETNV